MRRFARFLRLRADALLTDDYYASDVAWVDLKNPKVDVIFAPYETYLKNFMDARVREIILPLAARVMDAAQAKQASGEGYLASTILHEICHGLGPAFARR